MTVLIWGGAGGIGAALARALTAEGRRVHLVGRNGDRLAAVAAETGASLTVADATDAESVRRATEEAAAEGLTGLAYCAGTINLKPATRLTEADVERDFAVNAMGAFRAAQAAIPHLKAAPGSPAMLFFSTVAAAQGFTAHVSVAMAKGAVEGLTLSLAAELAPKIRVNCIAPSLTRTPLAEALTRNEQMATAIAALHPLARLGEPEDVAPLAALLLSDRAAWTTGQVIHVDGGRSTLRTKG